MQSINLPNVLPGTYTNNTLNAGLVAGTDTGVLRPNAAGTLDALLYAEQGTLAANGLALAFLQPGIYTVESVISQAASAANTYAAVLGNTSSPLTNAAAPTFATAGLVQLVSGVTTPAATAMAVKMNFTLAIRLGTARLTPSVTSGNTLKFIATAAAGGIVTNLTAAGWSIRVVRVNDLYA